MILSECGIPVVRHGHYGVLRLFYPIFGGVNLEFRLLEFRVTGAPAVPNFQNLDAPVPVVVEDFHRAIASHKVNLSRGAPHKLAVICECLYVEVGEINVFFEDLHAAGAM